MVSSNMCRRTINHLEKLLNKKNAKSKDFTLYKGQYTLKFNKQAMDSLIELTGKRG